MGENYKALFVSTTFALGVSRAKNNIYSIIWRATHPPRDPRRSQSSKMGIWTTPESGRLFNLNFPPYPFPPPRSVS
ncbi:hypothetical protein NPIL_507111 [Nephila pilipes]|uniref:Uncharacterized protein n=1 Tax=Nephila pilipes TaxID=299642 RepID=A0A8X6UPX7_NEPPI|nr:hypothetical protein NPIL_507111 [Nephila pilipes]